MPACRRQALCPLRHAVVNPVRNSSPAIAGLETERGIISNGVKGAKDASS